MGTEGLINTIVTPWEAGVNRREKVFLSVPVALRIDEPGSFYLRDAITKKRVSDIHNLDVGTHHLSVKLTKPTQYVEWVITNMVTDKT